jgi:hypothetical protein
MRVQVQISDQKAAFCVLRGSFHILCSIIYFPKILPFMGQCGNIITARRNTDADTAHALCILDT